MGSQVSAPDLWWLLTNLNSGTGKSVLVKNVLQELLKDSSEEPREVIYYFAKTAGAGQGRRRNQLYGL